MNKPHSLYIGLMSGTSLDGIDAVLTKLDPNGGTTLLGSISSPFAPELRTALLDLQTPGHNEIHLENQAANMLAIAYAETVQQLLTQSKLKPSDICAIGAHGQTIRHQAELPNQLAYTHQTLNPALLAELTDIDVIADFRSRDLAAGGHGAPLVPAFHAQLFGCNKNIAVLNVGGIANLTLLPNDGEVRGFDCGPGNMLMDAWIAEQQGHAFDEDGKWASQGQVDKGLLTRMLADPFFSKAPPKSTGRDDFHLNWLQQQVGSDNIHAEDIQASLLHLTVHCALQALERHAPQTQTLIVCGGGACNGALMRELKAESHTLFNNTLEIVTSEALGIDPQLVEALAFAWLAWAHQEKRPANLPAVTGAKGLRILGACYPA
ncbi:anhydro-N-acetylmuramic acid kinase [Polynucleobacter antarcticus]|uniref:Anhydro-N-acetylmuramic acid kinase n=1 Tax=Polynucleobacter antarcticus TaxID=1743162 RepID=A0A6M9PWG7_9BURK|nr:anhydro-N-acetylmuramic acid kinase [Polynucleobacter antarcticus]QKM63738.1 anhydro-N-acetylmuramic acid kinase [Polynucleobacter antarcticus]